MLPKEQFIETINNIKKQQDRVYKFNNALNEICDGYPVFDDGNLYLESLINLLRYTMHDSGDYIAWWLWEDVPKIVWDRNNSNVKYDLTTVEQLYDFLVGEYNKKQ